MKARIYRRHLLNRSLWRATTAEGFSMQNDNHEEFCMVWFISRMHPTLNKAFGCVVDVIQLLC